MNSSGVISVYPDGELATPLTLLRLMGQFWSDIYDARNQILTLVAAEGELLGDALQRFREAVDCLGRDTVPLFRRQSWRYFPLIKSDKSRVPLRYGDGALFGDPIEYGVNVPDGAYGWTAPAGLAECYVITNRLTEPSAVLIAGIDFEIKNDRVFFHSDPFLDERFTQQVIGTESGDDTVLAMWLYRPGFDRDYVFKHHGFLVTEHGQPTQAYKDQVVALLDAAVFGPSLGKTVRALAAAVGEPLIEPGEVIVDIAEAHTGWIVVTDKSVKILPEGALPAPGLEVGDSVEDLAPASDGLAVHEFNSGEVPDWLDLLCLGRGWLSGAYRGPLVFRNEEVEVQTVIENDRLKVFWDIGGFPDDVERFWDEVHARGESSGKTLANYLDLRENPSTETEVENLPDTVNPLKFLAENFLRYGSYLIRCRLNGSGAGLSAMPEIRRLLPVQTGLIIILETSYTAEASGPDDQSDLLDDMGVGMDMISESQGPGAQIELASPPSVLGGCG